MLLKMIQDGGNRWKHIAEALHTYQRTPAMVRNRYLRITNGRKLTKEGQSKNRCGTCRELKRGHVCEKARPKNIEGQNLELYKPVWPALSGSCSRESSAVLDPGHSQSGSVAPPPLRHQSSMDMLAEAASACVNVDGSGHHSAQRSELYKPLYKPAAQNFTHLLQLSSPQGASGVSAQLCSLGSASQLCAPQLAPPQLVTPGLHLAHAQLNPSLNFSESSNASEFVGSILPGAVSSETVSSETTVSFPSSAEGSVEGSVADSVAGSLNERLKSDLGCAVANCE